MATKSIPRSSVPPQSPRDLRSPSPPPSAPDPTIRPSATPAPKSRAQSLAPTAPGEPDNEPEQPLLEDAGDTIDMDTFHQILDLDEDDTHDFSRGMAWAYFSQASTTFTEMDEALAKKDLAKLSSLGHFLKGSSAALGVARVQASCEQIQHYGNLRDEEHAADLEPTAALAKIEPLLIRVKAEYATAEKWLKQWYEQHGGLQGVDDGDGDDNEDA